MYVLLRSKYNPVIQISFWLQKAHYNNFWWKYIRNESQRSYLGNKKQKICFQLFLIWRLTLVLCASFLRAQSGASVKFHARKIGRDEVNLSTLGVNFCAFFSITVGENLRHYSSFFTATITHFTPRFHEVPDVSKKKSNEILA